MSQAHTASSLFTRLIRLTYRLTTGLLVSAIVILFTLISLLLFHPKAPNYIWPYLPKWTNQTVSISHSEGSLYSGLNLYHIQFDDGHTQLDVEQLTWRWNLLPWLYGDFRFKHLAIHQLKLNLSESNEAPQPFNWQELYLSLQQPFGFIKQLGFDLAIDHLTLQAVSIQQANQEIIKVDYLNSQLGWQARQLRLDQLTTQFELEHHPYQAWLNLRAHFLDPQKTEGQLALTLNGLDNFEPLNLELSWFGTLDNLDFTLNSQSPYSIRSTHQLKLDPTSIQLESNWQQIMAEINQDWRLQINDSKTLNRFDFELGQSHHAIALKTQINDWPQKTIELTAHYTLAQQLNYQLDLLIEHHGQLVNSGAIQWPNASDDFNLAEPKNIQLDLKTHQLNLAWLDPSLNYHLTSDLNWHLSDFKTRLSQLKINKLDLSGLPYSLSMAGQLDSQLNQDDKYAIELNLDSINYADQQGRLLATIKLNKPLDEFVIDQLVAEVGNNQLELQGELKQQDFILTLTAQLNQLETLAKVYDIQGQTSLKLSAHGQLTPELNGVNQAWLNLDIEAPSIQYQDFLVKQLKLAANLPLHDLSGALFDLELANLIQLPNQSTNQEPAANESNSLISDLTLKRQRASQLTHGINTDLALSNPNAQLTLSLFEANPSLDNLGVDIRNMQIIQPNTGIWQLTTPSQLTWQKKEGLELSSTCLALASSSASQMCVAIQQNQASWQLIKWPIIDWITPFIPENLTIKAELDGQGHVNWQDTLEVKQTIRIKQADITLIEQGYEWPLSIEQLELDLNWNPEQATLTTHALVNKTGNFVADLKAYPNPEWNNAELDGVVRLNLNDLILSEQFMQQFEIHQTQLDLQTSIMGSLSAIQHNTRANLRLDFDIPLLELNQQTIQLQGDIANDQINAIGLWQQPQDRQAQLSLKIAPLSPEAEVELQVFTESIELLKAPFARVFTAADLKLFFGQDRRQIEGKIELHNSFIDLAKMPLHQRTTPSEDEIIIGADGDILHSNRDELPIEYNLSIGFGENVQVNVMDAQANLGGELRLSQTHQDQDMRAFGEVRFTSGYIQLERRNRVLIDGSRFSFNGNIANPQLNVNIYRVVERTTARLNITGTPTQPQFIFYSNPPMSEGRIINLLIFGRTADLENEPNYESQILTAFYRFGIQNNSRALNRFTRALGVQDIYFDVQDNQVSNLLLGRSLTDNLYIRYAHDMSGQQNNAIQVFLQIHENLILKSDNRDDRSSIDLIHQRQRK
ncbi:translocation/assembly module TamB domain-containing protein [Thiomicrospira sp. R3]|uniref:translocation/assembly module TamB domain-containing protein n=1 Tax=Thiomicrospira sp. R3 TaxID=3035472 RepID=UPI00259B0B69|nr:translocation/assembly module TamB domain-containing protein [Thiomicrospira sp. R3]WFE68765.1 translocation/assembly module TamB domain-containing protein [Thiomicrospira sp. R3]